MKVLKLLRDVRPFGKSGEIVKVSPDHTEYLLSLGMAVQVAEIRERIETPAQAPEVPAEKPVKTTARKTKREKGK